uniref:RING-type E3 ubiquitin transferase n=1 Tax=Branchiostoma floridae TaxID=7739 RepID=C3YIS9_BRAFL|eukprot:XP_002603792.1 hypothetical protein BRAFLDRAFT_124670 [Branchiostoma floridae]
MEQKPQPRPIGTEWIELAMQGQAQEIYKEPTKIVLYSLGWAICAVIGILFIIIMPIVGLCFCCCRCCGNCGGKMQQTVRDNMVCKRRVFEVFLFVVTILIAVGMVFAFLCNDALSTSVTQANTTISGTFQNVRRYFNNTKTQLDYIVDQYDTMSAAVNYDLDNIDQTLGVAVQERLRPQVGTTVNQLVDMINTVEPTKAALLAVQIALGQLQTGAQDLSTALADQRTTLNATLNFCQPSDTVCVNLRNEVNQLSPGGDFSALNDVNAELDAVNNLLQSYDISAIAEMASNAFEGIPNRVQNYSTDVVADVKKLLADNKDVFGNLSASLNGQVQAIANSTEVYQDAATQYLVKFVIPNNMYRWYAGLGLCCLVLLVVVFNLLGLIFGLCSYNSDHTPTTRTCGSTTGGNLLMSSVGFAFLFCWLLMLLVTIFFLVGSPMERFMCRPLETQEIFAETIDKPYFFQMSVSSNNSNTQSGTPAPSIKYWLGQLLLQDDQIPMKAGDILRNCSENKGLLAVLQLDRYSFGGVNTTDLLNQINNINIDDQLDPLNVDFSTVKVLDQDTRDSMNEFKDSGVSNIDFDAYLAEVNKGLTQVDLPTYAQGLRTAADNFQPGSNPVPDLLRMDPVFRGQKVSLSLQPFEHPLCTDKGDIFDLMNIVPWLKKYGTNPITGEKMEAKALNKLTFHKNSEDKYHCPVTFKVFNENAHIVAIKKTGNVYSYEAVERLNIRPKNWKDLLTDEPISRKDIITLQDPTDLDKFNFNNFHHLKHNLKLTDEDSGQCFFFHYQDVLKNNIQQLKQTVSDLQTTIDTLLTSAQDAETYLQNEGGNAVKEEAKTYANTLLGYAQQYADWIMVRFSDDFGGCKPVSDAYQSIVLLACSYFLDAFNGFWFGLGWCLLFYVPSIIFGVKLAKHYRRMDYETEYDYDYRYENVPMSNATTPSPGFKKAFFFNPSRVRESDL